MLENGFVFSNNTGNYEITTMAKKHILHPPNYDPAIIYRNTYAGEKNVYYVSFGEESPLMKFSNIDPLNNNQILSFCNCYGLLTDSRSNVQSMNDELYSAVTKKDPLSSSQRRNFEEGIGGLFMMLWDFKKSAAEMQQLIKLKTSIDTKNVIQTVETVTYFLFDEELKKKDKNIVAVDGSRKIFPDILHSYETPLFNRIYRDTCESEGQGELSLHERVKSFVHLQRSEMHKKQFTSINGFNPYVQTPYIHGTWQTICDLYSVLLEKFSISSIDPLGKVVFEPTLTVGGIRTIFNNVAQIIALGKAVFSDHLNTQLENVKPVFKIVNGKYVSTWDVPSLLEAMYLELFLNVTVSNNTIKRCGNENCRNYFIAENPRKIYCCPQCAWATNKRYHRKADK